MSCLIWFSTVAHFRFRSETIVDARQRVATTHTPHPPPTCQMLQTAPVWRTSVQLLVRLLINAAQHRKCPRRRPLARPRLRPFRTEARRRKVRDSSVDCHFELASALTVCICRSKCAQARPLCLHVLCQRTAREREGGKPRH